MKVVSASIAFLGVCLLISVWILSNAISIAGTNFPKSMIVTQVINEEFELVVRPA